MLYADHTIQMKKPGFSNPVGERSIRQQGRSSDGKVASVLLECSRPLGREPRKMTGAAEPAVADCSSVQERREEEEDASSLRLTNHFTIPLHSPEHLSFLR